MLDQLDDGLHALPMHVMTLLNIAAETILLAISFLQAG